MSATCHCDEIYASLWELLDGECSDARRAELRAAIESCPGCFAKLGLEEQVRAVVRRCGCDEAPPSLKEKIALKISVARTTVVRYES